MAETDILNPLNWAVSGIKFNPNPSYGFSRKSSPNRTLLRRRLGPFISRTVGNGGHIFTLGWTGIPLEIVERIEQFYHSFKDGYFTIIDVDGGGRHYVGTFTAEPESDHTANGKYNIAGLTFEEVPTARMLVYPYDFVNDGHPINVVDDYLNPRVAVMQGTWIFQPIAGASATTPTAIEAYDAAGTAGDWAQTQYVGWGYRVTFRLAASLGVVNLFLDGVEIVTNLDLSNGTSTATNGPTLTVNAGVSVTVAQTNVPLDMHRFKVYGTGTPSAGAGTAIIFPKMTYIY